MFEVKIREPEDKDLNQLHKLAVITFIDSYISGYPKKKLEKYAKETYSKTELKEQLKSADNLFYVAVLKKELTGYLKLDFNMALSRKGQRKISKKSATLTGLYVLPEMTGKRIGSKLLGKAFEIAREKNIKKIWLRVWKKNERAIRFYQSMGFKISGSNSYEFLTDEKTADTIMQREL